MIQDLEFDFSVMEIKMTGGKSSTVERMELITKGKIRCLVVFRTERFREECGFDIDQTFDFAWSMHEKNAVHLVINPKNKNIRTNKKTVSKTMVFNSQRIIPKLYQHLTGKPFSLEIETEIVIPLDIEYLGNDGGQHVYRIAEIK